MPVYRSRLQPKVIEGKTEREEAYHAALKLVTRIAEDLSRGVHPFRDSTGRPLTTLDEVIRAILSGSLPEEA